ncbi:NAD(P)-binding protein [Favolaschia claudopus]|uniref:NAD(P)-binding protein n=1 Tax=Favolaschia claudopus TaxID=2862362 RepID=A0AAV9Z751_9AGAR
MAHPNFISNARTLVIGGSSGLGFAVASGALANGCKVHITSVTPEKLSAKIKQLQGLYPNAPCQRQQTLQANLQSTLDAAVKETGGPLDHVAYTAGDSFPRNTLADTTPATALSAFTVRYLGPLLIGKLVAANPGKYLTSAASSSITLTSGVLGYRPMKGVSPTIGVVGAVEVLTRGLAVDLAPIRVNVVCPGYVYTELVQGMMGGSEEGLAMIKAASLTKEIPTPEAGAETYLFCMRSGGLLV